MSVYSRFDEESKCGNWGVSDDGVDKWSDSIGLEDVWGELIALTDG